MQAKVHYNSCKSLFIKLFRPIFEPMIFRDRAILKLESVDSTNNYAANLLKLTSPPNGTVITAQEQTRGKGQRGSDWIASYSENLLSSIIVYPDFIPSERTFLLSQATALAVRDLVESFTDRDTFIKWPNDIICMNKKVAGILIELNWLLSKIQSAIIGAGINVNQLKFDFPNAASLKSISNKSYILDNLLADYLSHFDRRYEQLNLGQYRQIHEEFNSFLWKKEQWASFIYNEKKMDCMILEAQIDGKLHLMTEKQSDIYCDLKEISMIF